MHRSFAVVAAVLTSASSSWAQRPTDVQEARAGIAATWAAFKPHWAAGHARESVAAFFTDAAINMISHGGTFNLAFHTWDEPAERAVAAAAAHGVPLVMHRSDESIRARVAAGGRSRWLAASKRYLSSLSHAEAGVRSVASRRPRRLRARVVFR
jgi:hypothetical protein